MSAASLVFKRTKKLGNWVILLSSVRLYSLRINLTVFGTTLSLNYNIYGSICMFYRLRNLIRFLIHSMTRWIICLMECI